MKMKIVKTYCGNLEKTVEEKYIKSIIIGTSYEGEIKLQITEIDGKLTTNFVDRTCNIILD